MIIATVAEGEFNFPPVGMGNNPLSLVDPTGGHSSTFEAFVAWTSHGFKGEIHKAVVALTIRKIWQLVCFRNVAG